MASFAGGGNTVKGVGTSFCADEDVVGVREAEKVAGLMEGQLFVAPAEDFAEIFFEKSTTKAETVELNTINYHLTERFSSAAAEILPTSALKNAVEVLAIAKVIAVLDVFAEATFGPAFGAVERFNVIFVGVGEGSELVKSHVDIRTNATLDLHGFFGTDEIGLAVEGINEADAFFGNVGETFFVGGVGDVAFFFHGDDFAKTGAK